ncbi:MAG TPA: tetratricopeptide repeat protein [Phycisphaerae bacterium]|nr:tetratricopeptide repeat protein [Phycisphaerae bacterium]
MKRKLLPLIGGLMLVLAAATAAADTITLKDGRVIQGHFTREGDSYSIQPDQGKAFKVPVTDLAGVVLGTDETPQQVADDRLQYALYLSSRETDISKAIQDIQAYLQQNANSPDAKTAQATLAQYVLDQAQGYVKFGNQWMSPADAKAAQTQVASMISNAVKQYRGGNLTQAQSEAQQVLAIDATNTDAHIIIGAVLFARNDPQDALAQFNTILESDPKNVIALNDAGAASFKNVLQLHALIDYQAALDLASGNRLLLDNIASALILYQGDENNTTYAMLKASFAAADGQVQGVMAQQGLYRAEAVWATSDEKAGVDAEYQSFQQEKQTDQSNYNSAESSVAGINNEINSANQEIRQVEQSISQLEAQENQYQIQIGPDGSITQTQSVDNSCAIDAANQQISQLQQQIGQLQDQAEQYQAQIDDAQEDMNRLNQAQWTLTFSGSQLMMLPGDLTNVPPPAPLRLPIQVLKPPVEN